MLKIKLL